MHSHKERAKQCLAGCHLHIKKHWVLLAPQGSVCLFTCAKRAAGLCRGGSGWYDAGPWGEPLLQAQWEHGGSMLPIFCGFLMKSKWWGDKIGLYPLFSQEFMGNVFRQMWGYHEVNFPKVFAAFFWLWSSAVSAEWDVWAARPEVFNCSCAISEAVASGTNTSQRGKTGKANLEFHMLFPVPLGPWQTLQSALQQHFQKYSEIWVTDLKLLNHGRFSVWFLVAFNRDPPSEIFREMRFQVLWAKE